MITEVSLTDTLSEVTLIGKLRYKLPNDLINSIQEKIIDSSVNTYEIHCTTVPVCYHLYTDIDSETDSDIECQCNDKHETCYEMFTGTKQELEERVKLLDSSYNKVEVYSF